MSVLAAGIAVTASGLMAPGAAGADPVGWHDFDGDGFRDLAVGIPHDDVAGVPEAGSVLVLYGTASGLTAAGSQVFNESTVTNEAIGGPEHGDHFGWALAAADFDDDGFADLAVGIPHEDVADVPFPRSEAGYVVILWGSPGGLTFVARPDSFPTPGDVAAGENYGYALDAIVWDPGKRPGLLVGVPGHAGSGLLRGGYAVVKHYPNGLQLLDVFACGSVDGDRCGQSVAAADLDDDGDDDFFLGAPPGRTVSGPSLISGGKVFLKCNTENESVPDEGPCTKTWAQPALDEAPEDGDAFGEAIAVADLDGDGWLELAVGAPGEDRAGQRNAGLVHVFEIDPALPSGPPAERSIITRATPGIPGNPEKGDRFGAALAIGNLGRGAALDLAIGAPGERIGADDGAGAVHVLYGGGSGIETADSQLWSQDSAGVAQGAEAGDRFGSALAIVDLGNGGRGDLVVGVPREDRRGKARAGLVQILFGGSGGLSGAGDEVWHRDVSGVVGRDAVGDRLGHTFPD